MTAYRQSPDGLPSLSNYQHKTPVSSSSGHCLLSPISTFLPRFAAMTGRSTVSSRSGPPKEHTVSLSNRGGLISTGECSMP
jgi:hypothetical protein